MPYAHGPSVKKLSKMATLLLGRNYILMLTRTVEHLRRLLAEAYSPPAAIAALAVAKHPRSAVGPQLPHPAHASVPPVGSLPPMHLASGIQGAPTTATAAAGLGLHGALGADSLLRLAPRLPLGLEMSGLGSPDLPHTMAPHPARAPFELLKNVTHPAHLLPPQYHHHHRQEVPGSKMPRLSPGALTPKVAKDKDLPQMSKTSPGRTTDLSSVVRPIPTLVAEGPNSRPSPPAPHRSHHHQQQHSLHSTSPSRIPCSCCVSTVYS